MRIQLTVDEWTRRLAERCPSARALTPEQVRAVMRARYFDMDDWSHPKPPAHFKYVLFALARASRTDWLYADDWKGPRGEAARAFERLLGLPDGHLQPSDFDPLEDVANDANQAASGEARLYYLEPFDDDCVFACMTSQMRDALVEASVIEPCSPA